MTRPLRTTLLVVGAAILAALLTAGPSLAAKPPKKEKTIDVQLLAINDFHGNLQPPAGSAGRIETPSGPVDAGGVEYLSTHLKQLEQTNPNTLIVAAGDLIGASPLISALFHDEPTIEAMNTAGLDIASVGNHEFDEGSAELLRMQNGGCHPTDGCQDGDPFAGADFQYLSANVVREDTGQTLFPAYEIRKFKDVRVAFIGMTLEATPTIVTPSGVAGLDFRDEVETVNALVPQLRAQKVEAIVVLIHEGGLPTGLYNECPGISGPIVDIVNNLDDEVDVVVSGHTHQAYNCVIDGKPVTSASSFGRLVTDIDLTLDRRTDDVASVSVNNVIVTRDVTPDPAQTALVAKYDALAAPLANRVIGQVTADITRLANAAGESALGDVIADAQLDATDDPGFGDAVVAFMNPGGIRADLTFAQSGSEGDGNVTYGEAFTVQPFGNSLVTMTLTGAQIDALLEQQWDNPAPGQSRILQVSEGFSYTWDASAPVGDRVDPTSITIDGVPIDPDASYRVTVNSFLADGGDNFTVLREGTDRLGGEVDLDALVAYFETSSPVAPGAQDRITRLN
jgi:5'-nucleotidase